MAWLQSSFTNHHLIDESKGNNFRKGYKVGSSNKDTNPDKSDMPLLHEAPLLSPESAAPDSSDWLSNTGAVVEPKKTNILQNISCSKPGFFSSGFFDRSGGSTKLRNQSGPHNNSENASNISKEGKKLLEKKKAEKLEGEDEEEDDSDDEWCLPRASAGYQRVKSGAD